MKFLLEKANKCVEKAMSYENSGNHESAKKNYLKASECLFKAAKNSKGELKEVRVKNAEKLLDKANSLKIPKVKEKLKEGSDVSELLVLEKPKVSFKDVAGLDDVKEEIKIKLIYPFQHPEEAEKYGVGSGGGILLYGPPGTGKTFLAKAVSTEVDATFFSVKPSEIMSKWVGEAEQNIEKLFSKARSCDKAVIFIDEVESLIPKRRSSGSTVMQRVVPQILAEMDGLESANQNLLFIGATNEPWSIDHAALRPGRFDDRVYIPPPDYDARKRIFELNLKGKPLSQSVDFDKLAELTEGYSGADIRQISIKSSVIPFRESIETGAEREIEMNDIEGVINKVKPSIDTKVLRKYGDFGGDRAKIKKEKPDKGVKASGDIRDKFPTHYSTLLIGPPGVGKHEYCFDLVKYYLSKGEGVIYLTTEKGPAEIKEKIERSGFEIDKYEGGKFLFIDLHSYSAGTKYEKALYISNPANLNAISINLEKAIDKIGAPVRVIFDSLSNLFLHSSESEIKKFLDIFVPKIKSNYGFVLATLQDEMHDEKTVITLKSLVDCVMEMKFEDAPLRRKFRVHHAKSIEASPIWIEFEITEKGFKYAN